MVQAEDFARAKWADGHLSSLQESKQLLQQACQLQPDIAEAQEQQQVMQLLGFEPGALMFAAAVAVSAGHASAAEMGDYLQAYLWSYACWSTVASQQQQQQQRAQELLQQGGEEREYQILQRVSSIGLRWAALHLATKSDVVALLLVRCAVDFACSALGIGIGTCMAVDALNVQGSTTSSSSSSSAGLAMEGATVLGNSS